MAVKNYLQNRLKNALFLVFSLSFLTKINAQKATNSQLESWFEAGDYEAIQALAVEGDTLRFWLGRVYLRAYRDAEALAYFDQVLAANAKYADAHFYRAVGLLGQNQIEESAAAVEKAIALSPKKGLYLSLRGDIYKSQKTMDKAADFYVRATAFDDCPMIAFESGAAILAELGDYKKAVKIQTQQRQKIDKMLLENKPYRAEDYDFLLFNLADNEYLSKQYKAAEKTLLFLQTRQKEANYQIKAKLVQVYYAIKDYKSAEALQAEIMAAGDAKTLPANMEMRYCMEQFEVNKTTVKVYQYFEKTSEKNSQNLVNPYVFELLNAKGEVENTLRFAYTPSDGQGEISYTFTQVDAAITNMQHFDQYKYTTVPTYNNVRLLAIKIISGKTKPTKTTALGK